MTKPISRERLEFLAELPQLLNSSLSPAIVAETALRYLLGQYSADGVFLFLGDDQQESVGYRQLTPECPELIAGTIHSTQPALVFDVLKNREGLLRISGSPDENHEVCFPLLSRETKPLGAVSVYRSSQNEPFQSDDGEYLKRFCLQLSLALENAHLFQKLKRSRKQIAEWSRKKDDMLVVLNHEIQTPLSVFQSSIELLASPALSDQQKQKVQESLNRGLNRLSAVARNLQNVTQVTAGGFEVVCGEMPLCELFSAVRDRFAEVAQRRALRILVDDPADDMMVIADRALLLVALSNLVSNAIRFTPDGGKVWVLANPVETGLEIVVRDTGIGIDRSQHKAIFEKFYEVADAVYHSTGDYEFQSGGLGLGLATVKGILEAHGSTISLVSEPGGGSAFAFVLRCPDQ